MELLSLLFFGRSEQTLELLKRLHHTRFLAVIGSSGCGKSSLIRAGLVPKLRAGFLVEDRDFWMTATMKPGDSPLQNLAVSLLEATTDSVSDLEVNTFVKQLRQFGAEAAITWLALALSNSSNLLLLIDQFEEIFRFGIESNEAGKREEAEDFVTLMLALAEQEQLPIYIVLTMRSDFIGDCDSFYGLPEALNRSQFLVPRLTRLQRQQAIEGPIRLFGAEISSRLLDRLLNDMGDKSDQLPVMQHALMRTWEHWLEMAGVQLDIEDYVAIGTIKDALSNDAEKALEELTDDELKITGWLFQALIDTDARSRTIRRPVRLSQLSAITGSNPGQLRSILDRFCGHGRSFLTIVNDEDPLIDISHESFFRQWERMNKWVITEVESRNMYLRVVDAAKVYKLHGNEDLLWQGTQLEMALEWLNSRNPTYDWAQRYDKGFTEAKSFLEKSKESRDVIARKRKIGSSPELELIYNARRYDKAGQKR